MLSLVEYNNKAEQYYADNYSDANNPINLNSSTKYNNIDSLASDVLFEHVIKVVNVNVLKKYLYQHEFSQILKYDDKPECKLDLPKFQLKAENLINKYNWKAGGYSLEDRDWITYTHNTGSYYDVEKNEILFVNTVLYSKGVDDEVDKYTDILVKHLNCLSKNIMVECRLRKEKKDGVIFVMLLCKDTNVMVPTVGL